MKLTRHALVVLSDGVLGLEYVTQELRWAQLYGVPLVVLGDGAEGSAGLVRRMEDECASMARLYAEKLHAHPPAPGKPWRILLGCDEHTPGSKVNSDNRRKTWHPHSTFAS